MKAKDLMIGDWVFVKGAPVRVEDVTENEGINMDWIAGCECGGYMKEEDLEPIPLTDKILGKNKFPYTPIAEGFFVGELFIRGYDGLYSIGANIRIGDAAVYYTFAQIRFVHELQHLIHLLGINKEIVL